MKLTVTIVATAVALSALMLLSADEAQAQFRGFWLDIGDYHNVYSEGGARQEEAPGIPPGMNYPAYLQGSSHGWARGFWIGTQNWTDENGQNYPYYVARIGPREPGVEFTSAVDARIISRYEDTEVFVDGALGFDKLAIVDEVDPSIPADRMLINQFNLDVGVTTTRRVYAYVNQFHDNYHLIDYEYCNTGNIDEDDNIELEGQTLTDTYIFHLHRWRSAEQAAWEGSAGQAWGRFNMIDVVGDGHMEYPVDFTAFYVWHGYDPTVTEYNSLGSPLWRDGGQSWGVADGDSVGRLSGANFVGRAQLHIDQSPTDETYVKCTPETFEECQPASIAWLDQDHPLAGVNESHERYYEEAILGLTHSSPSRNFPHYADEVEPSGEFWNPTRDASAGYGAAAQGGYAPTEALGPYDLEFGDCIGHTVVEGVDGLSYDAGLQIGRVYKRSGGDDDQLIEYDADGDGTIEEKPFNFETVGLPLYQGEGCTNCPEMGSEALTKNQWFMTARDSLFKTFFRARDVYEASNDFTEYPIPEAPYAPVEVQVVGLPDVIDISWTPNPDGGPPIDHWEIYRTSRFTHNLLDPDGDGNFDVSTRTGGEQLEHGYELIADDIPFSETSFEDRTAGRGSDYFYYIVGVGEPQNADPYGINGTPGGVPLMSSRYLTQTYLPATLKRPPYGTSGTVSDARIVPNPVNLGSDSNVRFSQEDRVAFFNIPPQATIKIFTEVGELVETIEHTDGSGDEIWNLTTSSRQLLVSGIYIAVIEDLENGDQSILKFTVIR